MTRHLILIFSCLTLLVYACKSSKATLEKIKFNGHCEECEQYINQVLIPQLETCTQDMDSYEDCKFDQEEFEKYGSCFLGMKKDVLEKLIGTDFGYKVKNRAHGSNLLWFTYYNTNNRLFELRDVNTINLRNSNIACLDCDFVYEKIRNEKRLKKMSFDEFHERYKGCFYGKAPSQLIPQLKLENRMEEDLKHYSYNKQILLGRDTHQLNFLFFPLEILVDISPVDSIANRVIN